MGIHINPSSQKYPINDAGLFGKRYDGYFNDVLDFFDTAVEQGDTNLSTQISSFTSNTDLYSWMWLGYFLPRSSGVYQFYTTSDDASYLWVGPEAYEGYTVDNAIVNNGSLHPPTEASGSLTLTAGTFYPMRIMFGENGGGDILTVSFSGPGISKTTNGNGYYFGGKRLWEILKKQVI